MNAIDEEKVKSLLNLISRDISVVLGKPGVKEYIGLILEWELRQVDDLILNVLENIDE